MLTNQQRQTGILSTKQEYLWSGASFSNFSTSLVRVVRMSSFFFHFGHTNALFLMALDFFIHLLVFVNTDNIQRNSSSEILSSVKAAEIWFAFLFRFDSAKTRI